MKKTLIFSLLIVLCSMAGLESAQAQSKSKKKEPIVDVYYFHRTMRCYSCKKVEESATKTIEENFQKETTKGTLRYTPINIQEPENADLVAKVSQGSTGLYLVKHGKNGDEIIDLNETAYANMRNEAKFMEEITALIRNHLPK